MINSNILKPMDIVVVGLKMWQNILQDTCNFKYFTKCTSTFKNL